MYRVEPIRCHHSNILVSRSFRKALSEVERVELLLKLEVSGLASDRRFVTLDGLERWEVPGCWNRTSRDALAPCGAYLPFLAHFVRLRYIFVKGV